MSPNFFTKKNQYNVRNFCLQKNYGPTNKNLKPVHHSSDEVEIRCESFAKMPAYVVRSGWKFSCMFSDGVSHPRADRGSVS